MLHLDLKRFEDNSGYELVIQDPNPVKGKPQNLKILLSNQGVAACGELFGKELATGESKIVSEKIL